MKKTVLFDLDGTLLDTERDFTQVLNQQLAASQLPPVSALKVRHTVSSGARALVALGYGIDEDDAKFSDYLEQLLDNYSLRIPQTESVLFPGIAKLLRALDNLDCAWGIVTNKPSRYAVPLVQRFPELQTSQVLVCADELKNSKPDPEGILLASERLQCPPADVLYVGDHPKDMQAAKAAGAISVAVRWGYIPEDQPIEQWQADLIINHPDDILDYIR